MDKKQYLEIRAQLVGRLMNAKAHHCWRTANARQRDIEKLDREWQALMT